MAKIRIMVVEDHLMVREGTCRLLSRYPDFEIVGQAGNAQEALEMAVALQPDIVLTDIRMPGVNGTQLVRQFKQMCPNTQALILSAYDDEELILAGIRAGASAYLLKTVDLDKLAGAIRTVHGGQTVLDPSVAARIARLMFSEPAIPKAKLLNQREHDVLRLISRGMKTGQSLHNSVLSRKQSSAT